MAAATRCDQGMTEMLEMADLVIREFKKEHPGGVEPPTKSSKRRGEA